MRLAHQRGGSAGPQRSLPVFHRSARSALLFFCVLVSPQVAAAQEKNDKNDKSERKEDPSNKTPGDSKSDTKTDAKTETPDEVTVRGQKTREATAPKNSME